MTAALPLFLALLLGASAAHKVIDRDRLAAAAARLAGTSARNGQLLLILTGGAEIMAALCLLPGATRPAGALIAASLWALYALALWRRRGQSLDCGCDWVARERPVSRTQICRPILLALLAIVAGVVPPASFTLDAPFAALGLFALMVATTELLAIPQPAWRKH